MGKFGDKFRKERERQAIKLEDVSTSTKISSRMLRAIEEEHFDQLPGGVFNKGFIRAYAKHLGLDEESAVAGYLDTLNQQNEHQGPENRTAQPDRRAPHSGERWHGPDRRNDDRRSNDRRSTVRRHNAERRMSDSIDDELPELQLPKAEHIRPKRKLAVHADSGTAWRVVALALALVAALLWWNHSRGVRANATLPTPTHESSSPSPSGTVPSSAPAVGGNNGDVAKSPIAAAPSSTQATANPAPHSASPRSSQPSPIASPANSRVASEEATDTSTAPAPKPRANLTLVIHASENSWISVTADGQSVIQETLIAPAHTSVRASREIAVRAGNSAGVTFSLNGQDFPAQGAEGEVKTMVFDASGMRVATPPPAPTATAAPPADPAR